MFDIVWPLQPRVQPNEAMVQKSTIHFELVVSAECASNICQIGYRAIM